MDYIVKPLKKFNKTLTAPADKSITQRAVLFGALGEQRIKIHNALLGEDCISSIECAIALGASVEVDSTSRSIVMQGAPFKSTELYVGNSGTAMRLLSGIVASVSGKRFVLDGDDSIRRRPMKRVIEPLTLMGARIATTTEEQKAPLAIEGTALSGIHYNSLIASAQVKSAVLLAGLNASGYTTYTEPLKSRDHTERLLRYYGVKVAEKGNSVRVAASRVRPCDTYVVGDISSAAYPLVMAAAMKGGQVTVSDVGINPTRSGILAVLTQCGAQYTIANRREEFEPCADIKLEYAPLKPFNITKELVPLLIDEIPILAVLACFIEGESVISGAEELKYKESNRIDTVVGALQKLGADIEATPDGMIIKGTGYLPGGALIDSHGDHRIAMSMAIAAALSELGATITGADCAAVSYPDFFKMFEE